MLDRIIKWSIQHKLFVGIATLLLIVWGVWSALRLPIDAVPDITNNQIQIITSAPSLATQEVEQLVTAPIERALGNIPGRIEMRSISRFGLSVITLVFEDSMDDYKARALVQEHLQQVASELPEAVSKPELAPMSTGLGEVYQYILLPKEEGKYSAMELRSLQDWVVARGLNGTKGVAEINGFGGELKQYEVSIDPNRLRSLGLTLTDVYTALESGNQNTGGAYIDKKPNAFFIRGVGMAGSLEDIGQIAIPNASGGSVLIRDVARVGYGSAVRYGALTHDGRSEVVGGIVMMQKGENSHEVVARIKERIAEIQSSLPSDVTIMPYLDRADLVDHAISTVQRNLIEGALIVIFVLVLFLGNWRAGFIVASAIPLAMLFALGMMNLFGISANLMSLGAIDFGLIIDGAVIVVEATMHHLAMRRSAHALSQSEMDDEVYHSASQIRSSATFGEIIILIVYIPILTLVGVEGKMFSPMAMVVGFAIIGALLLSLTYIPMMSATFLSKQPSTKVTFADKMMAKITRVYVPLRNRAFAHSRWVLGLTLLLFALALTCFMQMGGEFIPQLQEGSFAYSCVLPQGASLEQSVETSMQASRIIKSFPEVKIVVGKTGSAEVPTDPMPPEVTDLMVVLKPRSEWPKAKTYEELGEEISEKLSAIPGVFFERSQPIQMRFNDLMTGVKQDVAIKVFGENIDTLVGIAQRIGGRIAKIEGATEPQVEAVAGLPQINVEYDRSKLAAHGISVQEANDVLSSAFAGRVAGQVFEDERRFDVVVRLDSTFRRDIEDVRSLAVASKSGQLVPLTEIAHIDYRLGPAQISREEGKRRVVIGFNVSGRDVSSVVGELKSNLSDIKLPTGYYITYGGQFENLEAASRRLMIAVPISLFLIFALLYFTFSSLRQASLIFTAIPMSAIGGVFALLVCGLPFSISAGIGFIALFGVAVLNGIVLVGTFNRLEHEGIGDIYARIKQGTEERLRPVLMTAMVASIGFLPMALSTGSGAEVQRPLAIVVIGGLITATLLTLFVLPILYVIFNKKMHIPHLKKVSAILILPLLLAFNSNMQAQTRVIHSMKEAVEQAQSARSDFSLLSQSQRQLEATAWELPKMQVNAQYGQYSSIHKDWNINLEQSVPFPTIFALKRKYLKASSAKAQAEERLARSELEQEVKTCYQRILLLKERIKLARHLDSLYVVLMEQSRIRKHAGEDNGINQSLSEERSLRQRIEVEGIELELQTEYNRLAAFVNAPEGVEVQSNESLTLLTIDKLSSLEDLPQYQSVNSSLEELKAEKKLNKAESLLPDLTVAYLNQSLTGNQDLGNGHEEWFGTNKRFHAVTVGLNIPLSLSAYKAKNKSQSLRIQAQQLELQRIALLLKTEQQRLINNYRYQVSTYNRYKVEGLPRAERMIKSAHLSYKAGEAGHLELSAALEAYAEVEKLALEALYQANELALALEYLSISSN